MGAHRGLVLACLACLGNLGCASPGSETGSAVPGGSGGQVGVGGAESDSGGSGGSGPRTGGEAYSQIARVSVPESFISRAGQYELATGFEIFDVTRAFYDQYGDEYDFLIVYTDFRVRDIWQFTLATRADVQGIGMDQVYAAYGWPLDMTEQAGSTGRLQAVVLMNDPALWSSAAYSAQEILTHEVGHRWGANILLDAPDPAILLDANLSHWTIVAGLGAPSALGYGETRDLGGGLFESESVRPLRYAPLELYAMGLMDPSDPKLGSMFYVENAHDFVPAKQPKSNLPWGADSVNAGAKLRFSGKRVALPMSDILASLGPRVPSHEAAPKHFRFAFLLVCEASGCRDQSLSWVEGERSAWPATFGNATGQRGSADTQLLEDG